LRLSPNRISPAKLTMKKICLVLPLLLLIGAHAIAQKPAEQKLNIDSLIKVALTDSTKIIFAANKDSLFKLLPAAKPAAARIKLMYQIIDYGRDVAMSGLRYHYKILDWARKNNDPVTEAAIMAEIGYNQAANGDNAAGIKTCFAALKIAERTKNPQAIGIVYENLASCPREFNAAKLYITKALQYSKAGHDATYVSYALGAMSSMYRYYKPDLTDSGKYYAAQSFKWCVENRVLNQTPSALILLAAYADDKDRLRYIRSAAAMARNAGDNYSVNGAIIAIANYYRIVNRSDSALYYARQAYNLTKTGSLEMKIAPTHLLALAFTGRRADSALKYTLEYYGLRDSLQNLSKAEQAHSVAFREEQVRRDAEAKQAAYETTIRYYALGGVVVFLLILAIILWRNNRRRKQANELLQEQKDQVQETLDELEATQNQLIQSEKMASLGELTAGIAHEIQNPLNFVNNFSEVSMELVDEMEVELTKGDKDEAKAIASDIKQNLEKIRFHGGRADGIVKGMLQHSRAGSGTKELTDLNALADDALRLSYHGMRAKDKLFNADMVTHFDLELPKISIVPQDISRMLINLFNNAFYAVRQRQKKAGRDYIPTVEVSTSLFTNPTGGQGVYIRVKDNGTGIPEDIREKIMQPFFTTKPTGQGTGLGLSLSYDIIVKGHNGKINVDSEAGEYTEFAVWLPVKDAAKR